MRYIVPDLSPADNSLSPPNCPPAWNLANSSDAQILTLSLHTRPRLLDPLQAETTSQRSLWLQSVQNSRRLRWDSRGHRLFRRRSIRGGPRTPEGPDSPQEMPRQEYRREKGRLCSAVLAENCADRRSWRGVVEELRRGDEVYTAAVSGGHQAV